MKKFSKVLSLVLVFVMIMSMGIISASAAFPDVDDKNQYKSAIDLLSSLQILGGYEDGTFKPDNNITRAEFAKIVYAIFNGSNDPQAEMFAGESQFNDVKANDWFAGFVNWSSNNNILGGYGDGNVKPTNNVAVKEAIKMVVTCVTDKTLAYPMGYIQEAKSQGLLKDVTITDNDASATRGQVAQIAYNLLFTNSRFCLRSTGNLDTSGNETYTKEPAITFVYGLNEVGGEDSDYVVMLAATYDNLFQNTVVSSLDEGEVAFMLHNKTSDGMQGTLVRATPYIYDYAEDISDLFGQHLVLYLNDKDELIAVVSKSAAIHTTKNKMRGNGTSTAFSVDGQTLSLNSYVDTKNSNGDTIRYYVFDHAYVQQPHGRFIEGTDINNMRLTAICGTSARNYDEPIVVIDANNDGKYETYIQYAAATEQVRSYSYAGGQIKFGPPCDTTYYSNSMGEKLQYSSSFVDGFDLFKDLDFSDETRPVYANLYVSIKGDGQPHLTATVSPYVEGILESVSANGKTAKVDGKNYTSFYATTTYNEYGMFRYSTESVGSTVRVYLDNCGYAQAIAVVDDESDYDLHLCKVVGATDDADKWGNKITASITVIEMDGTQKTYSLQPRTDLDEIDFDFTTETPSQWLKTEDSETYWSYDTGNRQYAIVDNYIQLELDDTTGVVKKIATVDSLNGNGPTNTAVADMSKWSVVSGTICYDDENGFYVGDEDTVSSYIGWPNENFTGMYYEEVDGVLETEYYTASNMPEFYNDGDVTVVAYDREAVAMIVNTKPVVSTKDKILGIITGWQSVAGEAKLADGKNSYRYALSVWSDGETNTYYTEDFSASKLPTISFDSDTNLEGLAVDQLVYIQLLSNGKIKTKTSQNSSSLKVLDLDYVQNSDLNFAFADFNRSSIYTAYNLSRVVNTVSEGWATNPVTGVMEYNSYSEGSVVVSSSAVTLRTCDETTFYTIQRIDDLSNTSNSEVFQQVATDEITQGGSISVTDIDEESYYVFAYTLLTAETADNKDNIGKLGTVFVFNTPVTGKLSTVY